MNNKDLIFFNKEGYPMNLGYDEQLGLHNGKIYLDKNSTDTFKTQAIYTFEKLAGSNNTFSAYLDKYQIFNTNGLNFIPKFQAEDLLITNIISVNSNSGYNTKWIYADNIHKHYYPGMYCYITNIDGFFNNDFDQYLLGQLQTRKILAVEPGRILIWTQTSNNNTLPSYTPNTATIKAINCIEVLQHNEPTWNETNLNDKLYKDKVISVITNSENDSIYTINDVCTSYIRQYVTLAENLFIPVLNDKIQIQFSLKTSNIKLSTGNTIFSSNTIILPYIPSFVKVGDSIIASKKSTSLFLGNDATVIITNIDRTTNTLTTSGTFTNQTVDCDVYYASNKFIIEQEVLLDNNNLYSLPLTYWTIMNNYNDILQKLPGGYSLNYLSDSNELQLLSLYNDAYCDIVVNKINSGSVTNIPVVTNNYDVYLLNVNQDLIVEQFIEPDSSIYTRTFVFNSIDSVGISLQINGVLYTTAFDTNINTTISNWITDHSVLSSLGIDVVQNTNTLTISTQFANISCYIIPNFGDLTDYYVKYKDVEFNFIKSQLLIEINSKQYLVTYDTDDITTVTKWTNTFQQDLIQYGILVSNIANKIIFNILDPETNIETKYNYGYVSKSGDLTTIETYYVSNSMGSVISGNEIKCNVGEYDFLTYYSTGQKISINLANKVNQNKHYNIIGLSDNTISLSYQGAFWQQGLPTFDLNIVSDYFIRHPKKGLLGINSHSKFVWSWKDTQTSDLFLYDFSGDQLVSYDPIFPEYNGIKPLCGLNGEIELKLNTKPNQDLNYISDPTKQQTVFDKIQNILPYTDSIDLDIDPTPIQTFIGYKANYEGWNKARLYLDLVEEIQYSLLTDNSDPFNILDVWNFKENYVEILNPSSVFSFQHLGFTKNQIVQFSSVDVNIDNQNIASSSNTSISYKILDVQPHKITFTTNVVEETSIKQIAKTTKPFYDIDGNALYEDRTLMITIKVADQTLAYFDIYAESEQEDERHRINLDNKNKNILKLQDYYIFKQVDIKEQGIDWVFLNRKRKELIEIYPEIFNYLASYKSVIQAINFFGYNDLSFTEYIQNIDPTNPKFGQIVNMDVLNIFDKSVPGWEYSNLAFDNYKNQGYRKTNLFSLNYKITDTDGNFVSSYSLDEVKIKLLGLKKWLTDNIIPIGTKIADINGKYQIPQDFSIKHETYNTKSYKIEEYSAPIDCKISGNLTPITGQPNTYDISVEFTSKQDIEWYQYKITTYYLQYWNTLSYSANTVVLYNDKAYINSSNTVSTDIPGLSNLWVETNIQTLNAVQVIQDYKYSSDSVSFTINSLVDPYFMVEIYYHSGYGITHKTTKTYSIL